MLNGLRIKKEKEKRSSRLMLGPIFEKMIPNPLNQGRSPRLETNMTLLELGIE
jgi:hypothetical protein